MQDREPKVSTRAHKLIAFEITVPVEDVTDKLTLRLSVGEGEFDGEPVVLDSALPTHSPMVRFRGRQYLVSIHDIVKAICIQVHHQETA